MFQILVNLSVRNLHIRNSVDIIEFLGKWAQERRYFAYGRKLIYYCCYYLFVYNENASGNNAICKFIMFEALKMETARCTTL
jgi:hypothetical protein